MVSAAGLVIKRGHKTASVLNKSEDQLEVVQS